MKNVILDVDTGIDDALAIVLAVTHPELRVRAISCVGGNVSLDQVVANTLSVLNLVGRGTIPVAAGMSRPLLEQPQNASYVHGRNGIAGLVLPEHPLKPRPEHAVELLRTEILACETPVTLIALAPLTNIAVLLRMYPEVAENIERIVVMGGAVGAGNATATAEFNVWHDPEAAAIVFDSGVPLTMYGLEAFYSVTVDADTIRDLAGSSRPVDAFVGGLLTHLAEMTRDEQRIAGQGAAAIGDAGTVCAVIDPAGMTTRRAPVEISLLGAATRGQTVVDLRTGLGAGGEVTRGERGAVDVVLGVDGGRYARLFLDTIATVG